MDSPSFPQSPPRLEPELSPLFSPPEVSPHASYDSNVSSSSPSPEQNPPKKQRTWRVFASEGQKQASKSTLWRRRNLFGDNPVPEHELNPSVPAVVEHEPQFQLVAPVQDHQLLEQTFQSVFSSDEDSVYEGSSSEANFSSSDEESVHNAPTEGNEERSCSESDSDCDKFDSDDEVCEVYNGCSFSVDEAVLDLLTDNIENRESKKSLGDSLQTFLKYLPKPNNMPKTTNQLLNYVEQLAPAYSEIPHAYCAECLLYLGNSDACLACNSTEKNYFYMYSLAEQIRFYFEHRNLGEILDKEGCKKSSDGKIRDVVDGVEYQRVKINDTLSITLKMNTDGVALSDNSNSKLWPIMFVIVEVPPRLRTKFLIVSGVWCDKVDPPMNTLLKPIVDDLLRIHTEGGVAWTHPVTGLTHKTKVCAPIVCADAPARAKIQNILGHSGNQSCNTCEQVRDFIPLSNAEVRANAAGGKIRRKKGYFYKEQPAKLRTHQDMLQQGREAHRLRRHVQGVKGLTRLVLLPGLDVSRCVYAEYMHGTCLGVAKHFLKLWLTIKGPWNISKHKDAIDKFMEKLSPPDDICRLPRGISNYLKWKASEFRSWLLYYSLPALSGKLPNVYLQHWSLLVKAVFLLLQEEISQDDIIAARLMLNCFVRDISVLYRLRDNLYNVHQLLHLPLYVEWWGPLWATSAFYFESYNGTLVNLIHGTRNRGKELMRNVRIAHGVQVLRNKVLCGKNIVNKALGQDKDYELLTLCRNFKIPEPEKILLLESGVDPQGDVFSRVKIGTTIFTSKILSRAKRRSNHTAKFKWHSYFSYCDFKYFILSQGSLFAVGERLGIDHTKVFVNDELHQEVNHILPTVNIDSTVVVKASDIIMKMIRVGNYVCFKPNSLERNL